MSTGNVLYLLMTIAMFVSFAAVLAYYSWQQSSLGPEMLPAPGEPATASTEPAHAVAAMG